MLDSLRPSQQLFGKGNCSLPPETLESGKIEPRKRLALQRTFQARLVSKCKKFTDKSVECTSRGEGTLKEKLLYIKRVGGGYLLGCSPSEAKVYSGSFCDTFQGQLSRENMTEDSDLFQNWYRSGAKKTLARPSKQDLGTSRSLLEVLFRISDDNPRRFFGGLLPGSAPSLVLSTVNVSNFKLVSYSHSRSFNAYTYFQIFCKGLACFRLSRDSVRKQLVFGQPSIKISAHFSAANEFCRSRSEQHTSGEKHTRIAV